MVEEKSIPATRQVLEERVMELATIVRVCDQCAGDLPGYPDWLAMMFGRVLDIEKATQDYMMAVHEAYGPKVKPWSADVPGDSPEPDQAAGSADA